MYCAIPLTDILEDHNLTAESSFHHDIGGGSRNVSVTLFEAPWFPTAMSNFAIETTS
jgi:hypothetical protein